MGFTYVILSLFVLLVAVDGRRTVARGRGGLGQDEVTTHDVDVHAGTSENQEQKDGNAVHDASATDVDTHAGTSENQEQKEEQAALVEELSHDQDGEDHEEDGEEDLEKEDEEVDDQENEDDEDSALPEDDEYEDDHEEGALLEDESVQEEEELQAERDQEDDELADAESDEEHEDSDKPGRKRSRKFRYNRQAYNYGGNYDHSSRGGKRYNPGKVDSRGNKLSDIDWEDVFAKLPSERDAESKEKRSKLFRQFDVNGNGYLSLAEIDKGLKDVLQLHSVYNLKPAIMRAYQAARNVNGQTSRHAEDYVQRNEFRALMEYLRKYAELYVMFRHIDTNFDGRISLEEFMKSVPKLTECGVTGVTKDTFEAMDKDGGGMVLFDEFAGWAIPESLSLRADGPEGVGLKSAEGPTHGNYVNRRAPDIAPAVSLSLNGADPTAHKRLQDFYKFYKPENLSKVDSLLRRFRGKEHLLFQELVRKYGPEPGHDQQGLNFDDI